MFLVSGLPTFCHKNIRKGYIVKEISIKYFSDMRQISPNYLTSSSNFIRLKVELTWTLYMYYVSKTGQRNLEK